MGGLGDRLSLIRKGSPTYVLANALSTLLDLFPRRFRSGQAIEIICGVQLNGPPHLGTALTILLAIALARRLRASGLAQATVLIEVLDNAPGGPTRHDGAGAPFRKPLFDIATGDEVAREIDEHYGSILEIAVAERVPFQLRRYSEYQSSAGFRRALIHTLAQPNELGACINPASGRLPIRFPCPACGLVDVHSRYVEFAGVTSSAVDLSAQCLDHGRFSVSVSEDAPSMIDLNSIYRNVVKDLDRFLSDGPLAISLKGLDWIHGVRAVDEALIRLKVPEEHRPYRLFAPIISDQGGAKLSKSNGVSTHYLLSPPGCPPSSRRVRVAALFAVASAMIEEPALFFRGYSAGALLELIGE